MNRLIIWLLVAGTFAAAQVTQVFLTQQIQVANAQPGWLLVVGSDGKVTAAPAPPVPHTVFGSPDAPGCVAQPDGTYLFSQPPTSAAVHRGVRTMIDGESVPLGAMFRASLPGEYTITGSVLTFATSIPGEQVICDYTW